jgi:very-short-patch-repair endonuclease
MNMIAPLEMVPPPFCPAALCGAQMGDTRKLGEVGADMPRAQRSTPQIKHRAIELRKQSTPAEIKLWSRIRNDQLGITFRRQHAIGNYVPDFCSPKAKLIIELDGSQHFEQRDYDQARTEYLESQGYKVLRFWNNAVMKDLDSVIRAIIEQMDPKRHS